ncbi:MAG: glutamine amidotransferase [Nannocystaceae bacterium]
MSPAPILYAGDTNLQNAASYLGGLLTSWRLDFDYVPSDQPMSAELLAPKRQLYILSDYPARQLAPELQQRLVAHVRAGAGLLMVGGWESFCGAGGHWQHTAVAEALPVHIADEDDRVNCDQPAMVMRARSHPAIDTLDWDQRPPCIGGFNRMIAKSDASVALELQRYAVARHGSSLTFTPREKHPLLVFGSHGNGRTAALATDVAPHWVGGLVDWGDRRVRARAPGSHEIEVGDQYAAFLRELVTWTGDISPPS